MNKLLTSLTACAFGFALSSTVIAADTAYPEKNASPAAAESEPSEKAPGMTGDKASQSEPKAAASDSSSGTTAAKATESDPQAAPNDKPASVAKDSKSKPEAETTDSFSAALKKCDSLSGTEKTNCEKKAKSEHGKM